MAKSETRKRYLDTSPVDGEGRPLSSRNENRYVQPWREYRRDPDGTEEPAFEEVEVVEVTAVVDGEEVKRRVYVDQVAEYEAVLAEHRATQAAASDEA